MTDPIASPLLSKFANRFQIRVGKYSTRLEFGEEVEAGKPFAYHSAIILSNADASELADMIKNLQEKQKHEFHSSAAAESNNPLN